MNEQKYIRPIKKERMLQMSKEPFPNRSDLRADSYENATIIPLKHFDGDAVVFGRGGVLDSEGSYIESSGIRERCFGGYVVNNVEKEDSTVVFLGYFVKHWGHFLAETVARTWYCLRDDQNVDKYVLYVDENGSKDIYGNYLEYFKLLGIANKLELINCPKRYKRVVVPEMGYDRTIYYSDEFKRVFDLIIQKAEENTGEETWPKKVFFSRSSFAKANETEIGMEMLDSLHKTNGYAVLAPEKLTLSEMVNYINHSEICVATSGTLSHNFLFAKDGKKVIVIERQPCINEYQIDIERIRELDVTYVDANYSIYPTYIGSGPFVFVYNKWFDAFVQDCGMIRSDEKYLSEKYKKACIRKFLKIHQRFYAYSWGMESWQIMYADIMHEAYLDTMDDLGEYLRGQKPFAVMHYVQLRYIKQFVKRILAVIRKLK